MPKGSKGMKILDSPRAGVSLNQISDEISKIQGIKKSEVEFGDLVLVYTKNSLYYVCILDHDVNLVFGGWFDRNNLSPQIVSIHGCSWGSSIIHTNIFAACGLHIEFSNRVITSPIKKIILIHGNGKN